MSTVFHAWGTTLLLVASLVGCQRGSQYGDIRGMVTLDGRPLDHATVTFQDAQGNTVYGITNARGQYRLQPPGASVGVHRVAIETYHVDVDAQGNPLEYPEQLPERYHAQSTLSREVRPGHQTLDFDLETK